MEQRRSKSRSVKVSVSVLVRSYLVSDAISQEQVRFCAPVEIV